MFNAPAGAPAKAQNDKIVRALKKLSISNPDETLIGKMVSAVVALGANPQARVVSIPETFSRVAPQGKGGKGRIKSRLQLPRVVAGRRFPRGETGFTRGTWLAASTGIEPVFQFREGRYEHV